MLYIRNDFPQFHRQDLEKFNIDNDSGRIELLAIKATIKLEKWIFISVYEQPKVNVCVLVELMDKIMTSLIAQDFTIVFTDMNNYVQDKCNIKGSNNKDFWNVIKPFISNKSRSYGNSIILSIDDNEYTDPAVISSKFKYYFTNIAKGIGTEDRFGTDDSIFSCIEEKKTHTSISRIKNLMNSKQIDYEFSFSKVNAELVQKHINQLKSKKATGYDMIPPNLVKLGSIYYPNHSAILSICQ